MMIRLFLMAAVLSILAMTTGCNEMGMSANNAAIITQRFSDDNPDFNDASWCIVELDSTSHRVDGEYIDTVSIEVDKSCVEAIIDEKVKEIIDDQNN